MTTIFNRKGSRIKILVIPDSFKGSIDSEEYCLIVKNALHLIFPQINVRTFPMADGGENTARIIQRRLQCPVKKIRTVGADGTDIFVTVPLIGTNEAFVESASVVGLTMESTQSVPPERRSSAGIGTLIEALYQGGYHTLYIGLGGTGTNDGGYGLLRALGVSFKGLDGKPVGTDGSMIDQINAPTEADYTPVFARFPNLRLHALTDVNNPLLGSVGATAVFGKQKGVTAQTFDGFENALKHLSAICGRATDDGYATACGAGAAGGLGFALKTLNADMVSGADFLIDLYKIQNELHDADLVITGEGRSDGQTLYGKLPFRVNELCKHAKTPCVLLSGGIEPADYSRLSHAFTACFDSCPQPTTLQDAIANAPDNLRNTAISVVSLFLNGGNKELPK